MRLRNKLTEVVAGVLGRRATSAGERVWFAPVITNNTALRLLARSGYPAVPSFLHEVKEGEPDPLVALDILLAAT